MNRKSQTLLLPMLLLTVGSGWLLTSLGVAPEIDWVWTLGLAMVGALTLLLGGVDKVTVVIGPLFLIAAGLSTLRQTERLTLDVEVPILVILSGALMLVARLPQIPAPVWISEADKP